MTPEQEQILKETHEATKAIEQLLKGYGKEPGLLGDFENHKAIDLAFRKEFYHFKTWVYIGMAFAAGGGGAVGAGISRWLGN